MKICPKCEYPIEEDLQTCPYCGEILQEENNELTDSSSATFMNENHQSSVTSQSSYTDEETDKTPSEDVNAHQTNTSEKITTNENQKQASYNVQSNNYHSSVVDHITENPSSQLNENIIEENQEVSDFDLLKPHIHQLKEYFVQLGHTIVHPPLAQTIENEWLGIINFILIALFYALASAKLIGNLFYSLFSVFGHYGMYLAQETRMLPFFFVFLVSFVLLQIVAVCIYWGFASGIMAEKLSFLQALTRVFAPLSLLVPISLLAFLFALAGGALSFLALIFILFHFAFIRYSFHANLWLVDNSRQHNRFYITLIPVILYVVVSFVVMQILMHTILNHAQIQNVIQQIFNSY